MVSVRIFLRELKECQFGDDTELTCFCMCRTDPNVPRANKRFLSSIIRSTDDHNKAILRSQALAAAELKEERDEQERRERMARADEAAQDRLRRLMSGGRRVTAEDRWRPDRDRHKRREGQGREDERHRDRFGDASSKSPSRKRYWDEDEDEYRRRMSSSHRSSRHSSTRHHRRRHSTSRSRSPRRRDKRTSRSHRSQSSSRSRTVHKSPDVESSHHHRSRSRSPRGDQSPTSTNLSHNDSTHSRRRHRTSSRSGSCSRGPAQQKSSPAPLSPIPHASPKRSPSPILDDTSDTLSQGPISSKMDKYFAPNYDPRLDVAPLASSSSGLTIDVPATGLVDNSQFEGWDAMLELIRLRREDRMEKKRLERLGLLPEKAKEGRGKKGKGMVSASAEDGKGIMEIEYAKKGAVREWDMGKTAI